MHRAAIHRAAIHRAAIHWVAIHWAANHRAAIHKVAIHRAAADYEFVFQTFLKMKPFETIMRTFRPFEAWAYGKGWP
jgi:hypothetical protein